MIFETHAHYDDDSFDADRDALIASMPGRGIGRIINVGASIDTTKTTLALAKQYDFVTTKVVAEAAGMPEATTRRYLAKFSKMDIIVSDGKNRSKKYYLKNTSTTETNS